MSRDKLEVVFISAPYSIGDFGMNLNKVLHAAETLVGYHMTPIVPHLMFLWHLRYPHTKWYWIAIDLALLRRCDAVLLLPGECEGCKWEVQHAELHDIPIYHNLKEIIDAKRRIDPVPGGPGSSSPEPGNEGH